MHSKLKLAAWLRHSGQLLMFFVFLVCMVDLYGLNDRGHLLVPLYAYCTTIFSGVALNIIASPIENMNFGKPKQIKPAK